MLLVFTVTLFLSALLLFLVEPLIGKLIVPLLGGAPSVWNTCIFFFQAMLLAGYAYAHYSTAWLGERRQAVAHLGVLLLPARRCCSAGSPTPTTPRPATPTSSTRRATSAVCSPWSATSSSSSRT
jgi:hypothetical protein